MMGLDNPIHIAFLLVLLLLVFGAKRLPEMGRSLGAGLRGFKESISGETAVVHAEPARLAAAPEMVAARHHRRPDRRARARPRPSRRPSSRRPSSRRPVQPAPRGRRTLRGQGIRMSLCARALRRARPDRSDSLTSFTSDQ